MRSSWLASLRNRRSCSKAASSRSSMSLSVTARAPSSSRAAGTGRRRPGVGGADRRRAPPHRLDRPERGSREPVAGEDREQQCGGRRERELARQPVQRLLAGCKRPRHGDDRWAALDGRRVLEDAPFALQPAQVGREACSTPGSATQRDHKAGPARRDHAAVWPARPRRRLGPSLASGSTSPWSAFAR